VVQSTPTVDFHDLLHKEKELPLGGEVRIKY